MKKILLTLGTILAIVAPLTATIACTSESSPSVDDRFIQTLKAGDSTKIEDALAELFQDKTNKTVIKSSKIIGRIISEGKDKMDISFVKNVAREGSAVQFDAITITPKTKSTINLGGSAMPNAKSSLNIDAPYAIAFGVLNGKYSSISLKGDFVNNLAKEINVNITTEDVLAFNQTQTPDWMLYIQVQMVMKPESLSVVHHNAPNIRWSDKFTHSIGVAPNNHLERSTILAKNMTIKKLVSNFNDNMKNLPPQGKVRLDPENVSIEVEDYQNEGTTQNGLRVTIKNYGPTKSFLIKGFKQS